MNFDISQVPFSTRGSYLAFTYMPENFRNSGNQEGLYLRSIHGEKISADGIALPTGRMIPTWKENPVPFDVSADEAELKIMTDYGQIGICFADSRTIFISGEGEDLGLIIDDLSDGYSANHIHEIRVHGEQYYMLNLYKNKARYIAKGLEGTLRIEQDWNVDFTTFCRIHIRAEKERFLAVLEEVRTEWKRKEYQDTYEDVKAKQYCRFEEFLRGIPCVPERYNEQRRLAAYVLWASTVDPCGFLKRETMYMSKNWMAGIWSWDHCFNAIALSYGHPGLAWEQFMIPFDYQDDTGVLPDRMDDTSVNFNWCKPPVHGWTLRKLRELMELSRLQLEEAYEKLVKWTDWWLTYRRDGCEGIPQYYHGNDSGWDNASAFKVLPPVETPDLAAFLVIQMDVLSELARETGRVEEAEIWKKKADTMLEDMLTLCFRSGKPQAVTARNHEVIESESLLLYLPVILGDRLPERVRNSLKETVLSERYFTSFGFAAEAVDSSDYEEEGYWRGAVWAPVTLLLIDGLDHGHAGIQAVEAAEKFCEMVAKSGFAENFNAKTGEGLCDRAYTWTASVFLILCQEYLSREKESTGRMAEV